MRPLLLLRVLLLLLRPLLLLALLLLLMVLLLLLHRLLLLLLLLPLPLLVALVQNPAVDHAATQFLPTTPLPPQRLQQQQLARRRSLQPLRQCRPQYPPMVFAIP